MIIFKTWGSFLFNLFFDNTVHFSMAVIYNDLWKGITVQKYLLFWQYGFFNPIHTDGGHQMPIWLDGGTDWVSLDSFLCPRYIVWKINLEQNFWVSEWQNWMIGLRFIGILWCSIYYLGPGYIKNTSDCFQNMRQFFLFNLFSTICRV